MEKKGFTLIELLAVIVVLSVIALIVTPVITGIIDDARKESLKNSAYGLMDAAKDDNVLSQLHNKVEEEKVFTFPDNTLNVKGELPKEGEVVYRKDGSVSIEVKNSSYCAVKKFSEQEVRIYQRDDPRCNITVDSRYGEDLAQTPDRCFVLYQNPANTNEAYIAKYICGGAYDTSVIPNPLKSKINLDGIVTINPDLSAYFKIAEEGEFKNVVIPDKISGKTIIGILPLAFSAITEDEEIDASNKVIINSIDMSAATHLKTIGGHAFIGNMLTSVTLPESVEEIGEYAFMMNDIEYLHLPNSVKKIGPDAFNINKIAKLDLSSSLTETGELAFANNKIRTLNIPSGITKISWRSFQNNNITSLSIPSTVREIGNGAFNNNRLSNDQAFIYALDIEGKPDSTNLISYGGLQKDNVKIPDTVKTIDTVAFAHTELRSFIMSSNIESIAANSFNDNFLSDDQAFIYQLNSDKTYNNHVLLSYGGANKNNVVIPSQVTSLYDFALYGCQIENITLGQNIATIGKQAVAVNNLKSVIIPSSVTTVDDDAFRYNLLTSVKIKGKSSIENYGTNVWGWTPPHTDSDIEWNS